MSKSTQYLGNPYDKYLDIPVFNGTRKDPPSITQIMQNLYLGNFTSVLDSKTLKHKKIEAVVSLMMTSQPEWKRAPFTDHVQDHLILSCNDSSDQDILKHMDECCTFIDSHRRAGRTVAVHCRMGWSRSATIIIGYIMYKKRWSLKQALMALKSQRPSINPNQNFLAQLRIWEKLEYKLWVNYDANIPREEYQQYRYKLDPRAALLAELEEVSKEIERLKIVDKLDEISKEIQCLKIDYQKQKESGGDEA